MQKLRNFAIVFLLITNPLLHAQSPNYASQIKKDFSFFLRSGENLIRTPFKENSNFWRNTALTLATATALSFTDNSVRNFMLQNQTETNANIFSVDKFYGNLYSAGFAVFVYGYGLFSDNAKIRKTGLQAITAVFYTGIAVTAIKSIVGRHRPFLNDGNKKFSPFSFNDDFLSFPSGHATIAFALSTVMANSYDNFSWKFFWYSLAGLTATARLYHDRHWISDVFTGAVLGYSIARVTIKETTEKNSFLYIMPNSVVLLISL